MSDLLTERLNKILPRVVSNDFLKGTGIGNEIAFYIFDYPPEDELRVREHIHFLLEHIPTQKLGMRVKHINLFNFVLDYLKSRNLLDKAIAMQRERGDAALIKALSGPLDENKIAAHFAEVAEPGQHDLVILSGVGSVWPLLRSHTLLNNLHPIMGRTPLVMFYPGRYDGQSLRLFGKLKNANNNVVLLANAQRLGFNPSVSADNRTLILSPNQALPVSSVVTVIVTHGVTDLSGNQLTDFASVFATAADFDTSRPSVVSQRPGNGATAVPVTNRLVLFINEALNTATVTGALHVTQNGQLVTGGTVNLLDNGQTIEYIPPQPWAYGSLIQVFVDNTAQDLAGNAMYAYQASFTTVSDPSTTAPTVVNYSPGNGVGNIPLNTVVDVGYSEVLNPATVNNTTVTMNGPNGQVAIAVSLDTTGTVIHAVPTANLVANNTYCFYVNSGVQGTNGLGAQTIGYCFYTGSSLETGTTVVAVSPANQLGNVPVNANVRVRFSGPIDPLTVNQTTIQLSGGNQTLLPGANSFSENNQVVQITPNDVLPASTIMTLTIAGVTDMAGSPLAQTTQFTTGVAPQTYTTYIATSNPPNGAQNVPVNVAPSLQAWASIDATSVNRNSFQIYDTVLSQVVAGSYSLSSDGRTAYFLPNAQLATGRAYKEYINYYQSLLDLVGNGVCCSTQFSFTTGVSVDTQGPQVVGVSPQGGLQQVPINALVTVQFNEPVNSESLGQITLSANGNPVAVNSSLSNGNQTLTLVPLAALAPNTLYTITGVSDLAGNSMSGPVTSMFTTGFVDFSLPSVVNVSPPNGAIGVSTGTTVQIQFNKFMNALSITNSTFVIFNGSSPVGGTITISPDGTVATFTPSGPLLTLTTYTVQATAGIVDLEGQSSTSFQSTFTTQ